MKKIHPKFCGDCTSFYPFPDGFNGACSVVLPMWAEPAEGLTLNANGGWMMAVNTGAGACRCFKPKGDNHG